MAYNTFSDAQVGDYLKQHNLSAADPWGLYNHALQNNADPMQVARVAGIDPTAAQGFLAAAPGVLTGQIQGQAQLAQTNPQMAFAAAQARGYSPDYAEKVFGAGTGVASPWAASQGYTWNASTPATAPALQVSGTPTTAANSPATPNPYLPGGMAPSTTGSTAATMPATGGSGAVGVPDYMVAAGSGQQRNPYLPAGGAGSNYGNDPRSGGPARFSTGNQGLGGVGNYLFQNPSTLAMGNEVTRQVNNNLQRNILPGIRGNAMAAGTVGGSRQGVAEGLATGEAMTGLAGALTNLYSNQFNQDRSYGLQNDALDLSVYNANQNWMRQGQMDQLGAMGQIASMNQGAIGTAGQARDRPFTDWNRFVSPASQMAGLGGSQTQNLQGNPYLGAMGGWMAGQKMFGG